MNTVQEARQLAALAGIRLAAEREPALTEGLVGMKRIADTLGHRDYGETEPAGRFRAPGRTDE